MIPFNVDKDWYERYWYSEHKDRVRRPMHRPFAGMVTVVGHARFIAVGMKNIALLSVATLFQRAAPR